MCILSTILVGPIKFDHGPQLAPGPDFGHARTRLMLKYMHDYCDIIFSTCKVPPYNLKFASSTPDGKCRTFLVYLVMEQWSVCVCFLSNLFLHKCVYVSRWVGGGLRRRGGPAHACLMVGNPTVLDSWPTFLEDCCLFLPRMSNPPPQTYSLC